MQCVESALGDRCAGGKPVTGHEQIGAHAVTGQCLEAGGVHRLVEGGQPIGRVEAADEPLAERLDQPLFGRASVGVGDVRGQDCGERLGRTRSDRNLDSLRVRDRVGARAVGSNSDHAAVQQRQLRMVGRLAENHPVRDAGQRRVHEALGRLRHCAAGVDDVGARDGRLRQADGRQFGRGVVPSRRGVRGDRRRRPAQLRKDVDEAALVGHVERIVDVLRPPAAHQVRERPGGIGRVEVGEIIVHAEPVLDGVVDSGPRRVAAGDRGQPFRRKVRGAAAAVVRRCVGRRPVAEIDTATAFCLDDPAAHAPRRSTADAQHQPAVGERPHRRGDVGVRCRRCGVQALRRRDAVGRGPVQIHTCCARRGGAERRHRRHRRGDVGAGVGCRGRVGELRQHRHCVDGRTRCDDKGLHVNRHQHPWLTADTGVPSVQRARGVARPGGNCERLSGYGRDRDRDGCCLGLGHRAPASCRAITGR